METPGIARHRAVITASAVLTALLMLPAPSHALVQTSGCIGGDFGDDCSLAELLANYDSHFIRIDNLLFRNFLFSVFPSDDHPPNPAQIRVLPLGEGTTTPGIRLEPQGQFSYTPGLSMPDVSLGFHVSFGVQAAGFGLANVLSMTIDPRAGGLRSTVLPSGGIEGVFMTGLAQYSVGFPSFETIEARWGIPEETPSGGPHSGMNVSPPVTLARTNTAGFSQGAITSYFNLWSRVQPPAGTATVDEITYTAQLDGLHPPLPPQPVGDQQRHLLRRPEQLDDVGPRDRRAAERDRRYRRRTQRHSGVDGDVHAAGDTEHVVHGGLRLPVEDDDWEPRGQYQARSFSGRRRARDDPPPSFRSCPT
jgi:hypothetical protein